MSNDRRQDFVVSFLAYIEKQSKRYLSNLQSVLSAGEVEAVHDVRVASRRLAEPLRIAAGWLGRKRVEDVSALLRRTRQSMRTVRDLDVVLESLCAAPSPMGLEARDMARLEGELTHQRERSVAKAQRICRRRKSDRAAGMVRRIAAELADAMGEDSDSTIETQLHGLVHRSLRRLAERDPRSADGVDLHRNRILLKKLRYAVELTRDVCGQDRPLLHKSLVSMQDLLGHWNDQLSAARRITKIARDPRVMAEDASWAARLLDHSAHRLRDAEMTRQRAIDNWEEFAACLRAHGGTLDEAELTQITRSESVRNPA